MTSPRGFLAEGLGAPQRWVVAVAALAAALAHVPVIGPHLDEAPYMGVLFVVLTVGCTAIGLAAVVRDTRAVYALAVLTCGLAVVGYVATRLIAFPMLADDVGNWLEPLGLVSVLGETTVVVAAVRVLLPRPHRAATGRRSVITVREQGEAACTRAGAEAVHPTGGPDHVRSGKFPERSGAVRGLAAHVPTVGKAPSIGR